MESLQAEEKAGEQQPQAVRGGLSGSTLKLIAVITMLIDHIGATVFARMIITGSYRFGPGHTAVVEDHAALYMVYTTMRLVGRIAFPIYCFLLVEGFQKTRNVKKYALRLGAFALVSELPFDLAFNAKVLEFGYQNVFFTLFLGLLAMMAVDWVTKRSWTENRVLNDVLRYGLAALAIGAGGMAAMALRTDYGATGVACIMILYVTRRKKPVQMAAGAVSFFWEVPAPLAFLPIAFYNGKRGLNLKYLFYVFYPAHLLILYLVCAVLGFGGVPVV